MTPAEQFLHATEALIAAVIMNDRLKNTQSEIALSAARDHYVALASRFVAGV